MVLTSPDIPIASIPLQIGRPAEKSWAAPFSAELKRFKILVPQAFRDNRANFNPETEPVQIIEADFAVSHALDQMIANRLRQSRPALDSPHYFQIRNGPAGRQAVWFRKDPVKNGSVRRVRKRPFL
jgi:hypothetical protein